MNQAIGLQPDYGYAYNRGNVYSKEGNKISVCDDAKKACELGICKTLETATAKDLCR